MRHPDRFPPHWTSWFVDGNDLDRAEGYLITPHFEEDGRPITYRVLLSPGDPDPRDSAWIIDRIDSVVDSDGISVYPYLHLIRADGVEVARHPFDWCDCYPLVASDLEVAMEMIHVSCGNNLPHNFRAEFSVREA